MHRFVVLVSAGLLVGALAACGDDSAADSELVVTVAPDSIVANAEVDYIVDGDTIDVIIGGNQERVRLTGIDTPEISHAANGNRPASAGECFGEEATRFTESLLPVGTPVLLERDVVARDDYGRMI